MKSKKTWMPSLTNIAAFSYAVFGGFGIAVWHLLLTNNVPGANTFAIFFGLLQYQPEGYFLQIHAAATVISVIFAGFLFLRPPVGAVGFRSCAVVAAFIALLALYFLAFDLAILFLNAAVVLTAAWRRALQQADE